MLVQLLAEALSRGAMLGWFTAGWFVATAFWLWTLRDCLVSGRVAGREKTVWTVVLLATYAVGAVAYLLAVRTRRSPSKLDGGL